MKNTNRNFLPSGLLSARRRGFAQRRLQAYYSPLVADLFLWVYFGMWQIPNDSIQYRKGGYLHWPIPLSPWMATQ